MIDALFMTLGIVFIEKDNVFVYSFLNW